jgi:hypothetical protein
MLQTATRMIDPPELRNESARADRVYAIAPALLAIGLYARSMGFDFVWDDWHLVPIPAYLDFDLKRIFTTAANGAHYLPVRDFTLALDTALFGSWAGGFHITNCLLFAAAASLLHSLYRRLLASSGDPRVRDRASLLALACALVFVAHPLQVESVAFVSCRSAILALLFSVASLLAYDRFLEDRSRSWWGVAFALTVAALFSKQSAVSLPVLLLLLHAYRRPDAGLLHCLLPITPHLAAALIAAAIHVSVAGQADVIQQEPTAATLATRALRPIVVAQFYVWKLFWPMPLTIKYDSTALRAAWVWVSLSTVVLSGVWAFIVVRGLRARTLGCLAALAYVVALIPVSNILPTHPPVADRYAQLLLIPLIPLVWVPVAIRLPGRAQLPAALTLVSILSLLTVLQLPTWRNDVSLFRHAAHVSPDSAYALTRLSTALWEDGQELETLEVTRHLATVAPDDYHDDFYNGLYQKRRGELDLAEKRLRLATRKQGSGVFMAHYVLGNLYFDRGQRSAAKRSYERALRRIEPGTPELGRQIRSRLLELGKR